MAEPGDQVFRFLDLPRELRNEIYARSTTERLFYIPAREPGDEDFGSLGISQCVNGELRLVCRQFREEYEEESARNCEFTIYTQPYSDLDFEGRFERLPLPTVYRGLIRQVKLRVNGVDSDFADGYGNLRALKPYAEFIFSDLLHLPSSRPTLELQLYCEWPACHAILDKCRDLCHRSLQATSRDEHGGTAQVPISKSLEVFSYLYSVNPDAFQDPEDDDDDTTEDSEEEYWREGAIGEILRVCDDSHVTYRATPSTEPDAFHGFKLEIISIGVYDYERAVRQAEEELEERRARYRTYEEEAAAEAAYEWQASQGFSERW